MMTLTKWCAVMLVVSTSALLQAQDDSGIVSEIQAEATTQTRLDGLQKAQELRDRNALAGCELHVVGMYMPKDNHRDDRVFVDVKPTGKPMVLVLTGYFGAEWHLDIDPNADVRQVLVAGYYKHELAEPKPDVPIAVLTYFPRADKSNRNFFWAYAWHTAEGRELRRKLKDLTGLEVTTFQGEYSAARFIVDGQRGRDVVNGKTTDAAKKEQPSLVGGWLQNLIGSNDTDDRPPKVSQNIDTTAAVTTVDESQTPAIRRTLEAAREQAESQHRDAEQASLQAATAYRDELSQAAPDPQALADRRSKLQQAVKAAFEAQMVLQQIRLQLAEQDLAEVKAKHVRRESLAAKIIERRVADLISGEDLQWPEIAGKSPTHQANPGLARAKSNDGRFDHTAQPFNGPPATLKIVGPAFAAQQATVRVRLTNSDGLTVFATGTLVHSTVGSSTILTCSHFFRNHTDPVAIVVEVFRDGQIQGIPATMVGCDNDADIAVLQIQTTERLPAVSVAFSQKPAKVGEKVFSMGCSLGHLPTRMDVHVLEVDRYPGPANIICTRAPSQGHAGGGLFDASGQLIGVCTGADHDEGAGIYTAVDAVEKLMIRLNLMSLFTAANPADKKSQSDQLEGPMPDMQPFKVDAAPPTTSNSPEATNRPKATEAYQISPLETWLKHIRSIGADAASKREATLAEVEAALNSNDVAQNIAATQALAQTGDVKYDKTKYRERLLELCRSSNRDLVTSALYALYNTDRKPEDLALAQEALSKPEAAWAGHSISHLLMMFGDGEISGKSEEIVLSLLNSSDRSVRREALRGLWGAKTSDKLMDRVIELVDDQESHHDAIYFALATGPDKNAAVVDKLIEVLSDPDWNNWDRAIWGLGYGVRESERQKVAAAMLQMYENRSDPRTREKCRKLVQQYGSDEQKVKLQHLSSKPHETSK